MQHGYAGDGYNSDVSRDGCRDANNDISAMAAGVQQGAQGPQGLLLHLIRHAFLVPRRSVQRGIPDPTNFTKHPLIQAVNAEARKSRSAYRNSDEADPAEAFGAHTLSPEEVERLMDAARYTGAPWAWKAAFCISGSVACGYRADDLAGIRLALLQICPTPALAKPVPMQVFCTALGDGKQVSRRRVLGWCQASSDAGQPGMPAAWCESTRPLFLIFMCRTHAHLFPPTTTEQRRLPGLERDVPPRHPTPEPWWSRLQGWVGGLCCHEWARCLPQGTEAGCPPRQCCVARCIALAPAPMHVPLFRSQCPGRRVGCRSPGRYWGGQDDRGSFDQPATPPR